MNKELMFVALGVGIGAMAFTDQGRKIMNTITSSPVLRALGESAVSTMTKKSESDTEVTSSEDADGEVAV